MTWNVGQKRTFRLTSTGSYRWYRLYVTASENTGLGSCFGAYEIELMESGPGQGFMVGTNGRVGIGITNPQAHVHALGNLRVGNNRYRDGGGSSRGNFYSIATYVPPNVATVIKPYTNAQIALHAINGGVVTSGPKWGDLVLTIGTNATPVVVGTIGSSSPARTYTCPGEQLTVLFGGSYPYLVEVTGMGADELHQ